MKQKNRPIKNTDCVWAGEDKNFWHGATEVPVVHSVAFRYQNVEEWLEVANEVKPGHIYSRNTNPTTDVLESKIKTLENAEAATSFSTGMAAISNTLFALLKSGQRVVTLKDIYGGVSKIFLEFFPRFNIEVKICETTDHEQLEEEIKKGCNMLYLETPTNPTLKIVDIARLAKVAHDVNAVVAVDNTFATPINQQPLNLGADLSIHSATKFLGGHADVMGGLVCGNQELINRIFHFREINGATIAPASAYLLIRSIKTLSLRVQYQNRNAQIISEFLIDHPKIENVFYPGLTSHPNHEIAKRQMSGFGGVLSFQLKKGGFSAVKKLLPNLRYAHLAANLGSIETIAGPPATTSHVECTKEERAALGIPESLIRYSVGIENSEDLIDDLTQVLNKI